MVLVVVVVRGRRPPGVGAGAGAAAVLVLVLVALRELEAGEVLTDHLVLEFLFDAGLASDKTTLGLLRGRHH